VTQTDRAARLEWLAVVQELAELEMLREHWRRALLAHIDQAEASLRAALDGDPAPARRPSPNWNSYARTGC
jgi:hypothetical protein